MFKIGEFSNLSGLSINTLHHYNKIDGPVREIYHKGEWETNNPEEYVTELQFPLA